MILHVETLSRSKQRSCRHYLLILQRFFPWVEGGLARFSHMNQEMARRAFAENTVRAWSRRVADLSQGAFLLTRALVTPGSVSSGMIAALHPSRKENADDQQSEPRHQATSPQVDSRGCPDLDRPRRSFCPRCRVSSRGEEHRRRLFAPVDKACAPFSLHVDLVFLRASPSGNG